MQLIAIVAIKWHRRSPIYHHMKLCYRRQCLNLLISTLTNTQNLTFIPMDCWYSTHESLIKQNRLGEFQSSLLLLRYGENERERRKISITISDKKLPILHNQPMISPPVIYIYILIYYMYYMYYIYIYIYSFFKTFSLLYENY